MKKDYKNKQEKLKRKLIVRRRVMTDLTQENGPLDYLNVKDFQKLS